MSSLLHLAAFAGYLAAWLLQLHGFRTRAGVPRAEALGIAATAALLHAAGLVAFSIAHDALPLAGLGPTTSTFGLAVALVFLVAGIRAETWTAGLLLLPFVLLFVAVSLAAGLEPMARLTSFRGIWFVLHVGTVLAGYACLLLASVAAAMYLLQLRALKRKEFGNVFRFFPSLEGLDWLNRIGLRAGLAALTVGLLVAWGFNFAYGRGLALGDPEVTLGILTWGAYGLALLARRPPTWRRGRAAAVSVAAFLASAAVFLVLRGTTQPGSFLL